MCYDSKAQSPLPPGPAGAIQTQNLVLTATDDNQFAAYLAVPEALASAAVVILPDVRGLHQFYKDLAGRFAEQGIAALALDYFGRTAGLTARDDSFAFMSHVQELRFDSIVADAGAAADRLRAACADGTPLYSVGFCLGGALSFTLGTQDLGQAGVIGFYAGLSRDIGGGGAVLERAPHIKYPALALFGGADQGIPPDQVERFDHSLDTAGVPHTVITYAGAPHSFFDRRASEYATASADAWTQVLGFIKAPTQSRPVTV